MFIHFAGVMPSWAGLHFGMDEWAARTAIVQHLQRSAGNAAVQRLILQRDIYHENQADLVWKDFQGNAGVGKAVELTAAVGRAHPLHLNTHRTDMKLPADVIDNRLG